MISSFTALYSFSYLFVLQKVSFFFVWMPLSFRAHFLTTQPTTGNGQALTKAEALANTYILSRKSGTERKQGLRASLMKRSWS
jgi:hypothetical protein